VPAAQPRAVPPAAAAGDDCEVGKAGRKACKNCTCGRAEAEAAGIKVQLTPDMLQNPGAGSCGNVSALGRGLGGWGPRGPAGLRVLTAKPRSRLEARR
jgi:hypothetical protein